MTQRHFRAYDGKSHLENYKVLLRILAIRTLTDMKRGTFRIAIAVSGPTEHCPIFHFPSVRPPFVLRHRRDITTVLDILTVYTMKTKYFLNAYYPGW